MQQLKASDTGKSVEKSAPLQAVTVVRTNTISFTLKPANPPKEEVEEPAVASSSLTTIAKKFFKIWKSNLQKPKKETSHSRSAEIDRLRELCGENAPSTAVTEIVSGLDKFYTLIHVKEYEKALDLLGEEFSNWLAEAKSDPDTHRRSQLRKELAQAMQIAEEAKDSLALAKNTERLHLLELGTSFTPNDKVPCELQ
ncbi:hypothetical protein Ciccas_013222 [Cichlidogyrus casuarinus]|uniref:Uncharacterized protein n=1 Tax=Cichlidogyrus casuarinus TaxID=1844966 RepID=A0ABD2PL89_9PLAT